jgi:ribosomal protein S18 acetylase RimI-like enzyme
VSDAAALAAFAARTFTDTFGAVNEDAHLAAHLEENYGLAQQTSELLDPAQCVLLAELGDALAGYAHLRTKPPPPCVTGDAPVEIARFYVDRVHHGSGLAQRLMDAARSAAIEMGGRTLWLGVWEHNPRAIAYYIKSGLRDVGSADFFVGPDRQTDRIMAGPLAPPSRG